MKPIPKRELPNTITFEKYLGAGNKSPLLDTQQTITNVAFQEAKIRSTTQDGAIIEGNGIIFVDAKNSKVDGAAVTNDLFTIGSFIYFNNKRYKLVDIENLDYRTGKGIHHWELMIK